MKPTDSTVLSARALRVARTEQTARDVRAALARHGVSQAQVAADTGATPQVVSEWCDEESEKSLRLADARAIGDEQVRRELGELVMGPCFVGVRRHAPGPGALTIRAAAAMLRASTIAAESLLSALEDGVIDPAERRDALRKLEALLCDAEGMRTALLAEDVPAPVTKLRGVR